MRDDAYYKRAAAHRKEPIRYYGKRRDAGLSWTVNVIAEKRCFRHLTKDAIRSYLIHLATLDGRYESAIVRVDVGGISVGHRSYLTSKPPFWQWHEFTRRNRHRTDPVPCATCGHVVPQPEFVTHRRQVVVAPDAATRLGRNAWSGGLAFDVGNAMARVAWRLGVSCVVCGSFCGTRLPQEDKWFSETTVLGRSGIPHGTLCGQCAKNEQRDIRKWQRENGYGSKPPEEWLLLMAVERLRKNVPRAASLVPALASGGSHHG